MSFFGDLPNFVILGGYPSPGMLDTTTPFPGLSDPRKWDERKGYGLSGATDVFAGKELAKFSIKGVIWDEVLYEDLTDWWAKVTPVPNVSVPKALDLIHPLPNLLGINSVNIEEPMGLIQSDDGLWTWEIKVREYRRPAPHLATPKGSKAGAAKPVDPQDAEMAALTKQIGDEGKSLDQNLRRVGV